MKNLRLLRVLAVAMGMFIGTTLVTAQTTSNTSGTSTDKQEYYKQKQQTTTVTTQPGSSTSVKQVPQSAQNTKIVFRNNNAAPSATPVVPTDAKEKLLLLRQHAIAKGLPTTKYDEALARLNHPQN